MICNYNDLCSVEIQTIEHKELNNFRPVSFSKVTLHLHKNCNALIINKNFVQSTGALTLVEKGSLTMFSGNGCVHLAATKKHIYLLELNRSEIFVSKDYFLGYTGNIKIRNVNKLKQNLSLGLTTNTGTLITAGKTSSAVKSLDSLVHKCSVAMLGDLEKNFVTLQGNGFVLLALPFPLDFMQKINQEYGNTTAVIEHLIYFTLPDKILLNGRNTCSINGECEIGIKIIEESSL